MGNRFIVYCVYPSALVAYHPTEEAAIQLAAELSRRDNREYHVAIIVARAKPVVEAVIELERV